MQTLSRLLQVVAAMALAVSFGFLVLAEAAAKDFDESGAYVQRERDEHEDVEARTLAAC